MAAVIPSHGGEALRVARDLGIPLTEIHDFSASINPLGPPETVRSAVLNSLDACVHYPEAHGESLLEELADFHGLETDRLLVGNGSTELIYLVPRVLQPQRAAIVTPAFSEYAKSLEQVDCKVDHIPLDWRNDFAFSPEKIVTALAEDVDLLWLANPGNPSGALISPQQLDQLLAAVPRRLQVMLDEAFIDFTPEASFVDQLDGYPNLIILRSMTKFYAIPGLRVGYLLAAPETVARLRNAHPPWSLSTPALAAAKACLAANSFRRRSLDVMPQWRTTLARDLAAQGCRVFPSAANYLLFRLPADAPDAAVLAALWRDRGILIRNCGNFEPLDERFVRVAVRAPEENRALVTTSFK